eukprot:364812-Chlamydomonas_euryale.AAC.9
MDRADSLQASYSHHAGRHRSVHAPRARHASPRWPPPLQLGATGYRPQCCLPRVRQRGQTAGRHRVAASARDCCGRQRPTFGPLVTAHNELLTLNCNCCELGR